jgi:predicted transcriptional regulator
MTMKQPLTHHNAAADRESHADATADSVCTETILDLLGDEYTRELLEALGEQPLIGRELQERTGMSRATVYRRLDELQDAGLVESTMRVRSGGHHCKQFRLVVDEIDFSLGEDGFAIDLPSENRSLSELKA